MHCIICVTVYNNSALASGHSSKILKKESILYIIKNSFYIALNTVLQSCCTQYCYSAVCQCILQCPWIRTRVVKILLCVFLKHLKIFCFFTLGYLDCQFATRVPLRFGYPGKSLALILYHFQDWHGISWLKRCFHLIEILSLYWNTLLLDREILILYWKTLSFDRNTITWPKQYHLTKTLSLD